jgi:hypothetical protein
MGQVAQQHDELVAAEAADGIAGADIGRQAARGIDQQQVAGGMAPLVVDRLEAVQVEVADRQQPIAAAGLADRLVPGGRRAGAGWAGRSGRRSRPFVRGARAIP